MKSEFVIAIHALAYMEHRKRSVISEELAQNICTNAVRIRSVMAKLSKANWINAKEGIQGGYELKEETKQKNLAQLAQLLGIEAISSTWRSGNLDLPCLVASGMGSVMDEIYHEMNTACMAYLQTIRIQDVEKMLETIAQKKSA